MGLDRSAFLKQLVRRGMGQIAFEYACQAYRVGEISLSRAAELAGVLAGVTVRDMLLRLEGASLDLNYQIHDLAEDLQEIR